MTASVTKPSFNPFAAALQDQALPTTWHTLFADGPGSIGVEVAKFAAGRCKAHGEFLARINRCKTFGDVFAAQSDYFQETWFSYAGEAERLTDEANSKLKQSKAA